uniref:Uncharacterized protein n=1 Tax=Cacopsylla melanoneura TaxID=428564 RepID=A0A8D8LSE0_9HEMI
MTYSERKLRKNRGDSYVDSRGNLIPARRMKLLLDSCRNSCKTKFDDNYRQSLFNTFWKLKDYSAKVLFICKLINVCEKKKVKRVLLVDATAIHIQVTSII